MEMKTNSPSGLPAIIMIERPKGLELLPATGPKAVGHRLNMLRAYLGYASQSDLAEAWGIDRRNLNVWVNGIAMLPVKWAIKLKEQTGADLDYIYCGDVSSIPLKLAQAMDSLDSAEISTSED